MISLFSILTVATSILSEETQEEAEERVLAEAKVYVSGLSDDEFEAWVVSMEKMGRFLEIAKIMRIEWLIERIQSLLPEAVRGMDLHVGKNSIPVETLGKNSKLFYEYWSLFEINDFGGINVINESKLTLTNDFIGWTAYLYAMNIDRSPHSDTRAMACMDAEFAWRYARSIDKTAHNDTRAAACMSADWAYRYAYDIDGSPRDDTRAAACMDARDVGLAYSYARDIDKAPRDDTRAAVSSSEYWSKEYDKTFGKKP